MNLLMLKGTVCKDVEVRTTTNNRKVASIRLAVKRDFKNQEGKYESDFFTCTAYGNTAELIEKYITKGKELIVNCRMQNRTYEKDGVKKYVDDIIVNNIEFCGSRVEQRQATPEEEYNEFITIEDDEELPF